MYVCVWCVYLLWATILIKNKLLGSQLQAHKHCISKTRHVMFIGLVWCLHGREEGKYVGDILLFHDESIKKCNLVLKIRKEENLKYADVPIHQINANDGYHLCCYKRFVALPKSHRSKLNVLGKEKEEGYKFY